ncbi:hypothetical protein [Pedobacter panaciterrae]
MNFKAYDILSSLVPGFLILLAGLNVFEIDFDKDLLVAYTTVAFPLGYVMNSLSSWLEDFYFWTWGGRPSSKMLEAGSSGVWKVKFYNSAKVRQALIDASGNSQATNDELFQYACRYATGEKDSKVEDLSASYVFARSLLTAVVIGMPVLLVQNYEDWRYWIVLIPTLFVLWLRCKQRAYFYVRQVLNNFLKIRQL